MTSGIDTESIVTSMMAVERRPQDLLKARVATMQRAQVAWQAIADKLNLLKTASDALSGIDSLAKLRTVTSSNPAAVAVRATGAGANTSAEVEVIGLAAAKSVLAGDIFTATTDSVGSRTLNITSASGATTAVTSADGTIGGLALAINGAGLGVSAKVLQTAPGQFQLSLAATASGTAADFVASGTGWTSLDTVRPATDARLSIDGVLITRATNVISDVLDGLDLTLQAVTTGPVTISSSRDDTAITAKVKALVDTANALITGIGISTKASSDAGARGPLAGDPSARKIMDSVRSAIAQPLVTASGAVTTASALGISLTRDGSVAFDANKLASSLSTDPSTVLAALGRNAVSTANGVTVAGASSAATTSSRVISVTQAASRATLVGMVTPAPAPGTSVSMNIVTPDGSYNVSFVTGGTWSQTAGNLNAALRAAGVKMVAVAPSGGGIDLASDRFGTGQVFTVTGGAAIGVGGTSSAGTNAAGTIDAVAFTAVGKNYITGGLVLNIGTTSTQIASAGGSVSGTISLTNGLAGALATIGAQGSATGTAMTSKTTLQDTIDDLQKRVGRYDDVLKQRETALRARFTAMETMIQKLQTMTSSIGSLTTTA